MLFECEQSLIVINYNRNNFGICHFDFTEEENDYVLSSPFFLSGRFVNANDNDNNLGDGNNDNIVYGPNRENQKVSYGVVG